MLLCFNARSHDSRLVSPERACTPTCRSVSGFPGQDCVIGAAAVSITARYIRQFHVQSFNPAALPERAHIWDFQLCTRLTPRILLADGTPNPETGQKGGPVGTCSGSVQILSETGVL